MKKLLIGAVIETAEIVTIAVLALWLGLISVDVYARLHRRPAPPVNTEQVYQVPANPDNGIVRLVGDEGRTFCTGSVVNDNTVITAGHCVAIMSPFGMAINPSPIELRLNDNKARGVYGSAYSIMPQLDAAVLHGNFKRLNKLKLIDDIHQINAIGKKHTKLLACGYPLHGDLHCQQVDYYDLNNFMWSVKGLLLPGMSGGPVITPDGSVIGINDAVEGNKSIISPTYNIKRGF